MRYLKEPINQTVAAVSHMWLTCHCVSRYAHGRTEVQVTAFRTFMLRTISIYTLSYALFLRAQTTQTCAGTLIGQGKRSDLSLHQTRIFQCLP